ncbi:hypothetical protein C6341_g13101 [Phytophthora cactorum]|nr:hypothetical protein PC120_g3286 [Phytophthora cactorum]KAG3162909.1 hypothetical protein C6341_g13101 [Phytophthora cactorum]
MIETLDIFAWTLVVINILVLIRIRCCTTQLLARAGYTSNKQTVADKLGQVAGEEAAAWDALMKKPLKDQEGMETSRREKRKRDMCLDLVAAACAARDANSNPG